MEPSVKAKALAISLPPKDVACAPTPPVLELYAQTKLFEKLDFSSVRFELSINIAPPYACIPIDASAEAYAVALY